MRLTECLAEELKGRGIAVNAVAPGMVATEIHEATLRAGPDQAGREHFERTEAAMAQGGVPMEVPVACVEFLLSPEADGLTGKTIAAGFDPWRSEQRASIVLGTARSGTTKLAELLCSAGGARLLCEPLHTFYSPMVPSTFVWGQYLEPGARHDDLRALWSDCLSGRARHGWIDHFNQARIVRHRVVKEILR